jgi:hypothetical protein
LPVKEQLREAHTRAKPWSWGRYQQYAESIGLGHDVYLDSFTRSQQNKIMCTFDMAMLQARFSGRRMTDWLSEQSEIPSRMYARPSGRMEDPIQPTRTTIGSLASFYNDYFEHSETKIQTKSNRKRSLPMSSSQ